jgi:hypothetical protein
LIVPPVLAAFVLAGEPPEDELLQAAESASKAAAPTPAMIRLFVVTFPSYLS